MRPVRIQRKRTKGWRMPEGATYVGRPSRWGNPFRLGDTYLFGDVSELKPGGPLVAWPMPTWREPGHYDNGVHVVRLHDVYVGLNWFRAYDRMVGSGTVYRGRGRGCVGGGVVSRRADLAVVLVAVAILLLLYAATRDARAATSSEAQNASSLASGLRGVPPSGAVGSAIMAGNISWADPELGGDYLATRFPRGTLVRICGTDTGICIVRRTNDFGPHAGIRPNRIADLAVLDWEQICRLDRERGLCPGTVETIEDFRLPATDTLYEGGTE